MGVNTQAGWLIDLWIALCGFGFVDSCFFLFFVFFCFFSLLQLSVNLYELLKQNGYRGLSWSLLRMFLKQLLDSLSVLAVAKIIHCDLKPEVRSHTQSSSSRITFSHQIGVMARAHFVRLVYRC